MTPPAGWFVSPSDRSVAVPAKLVARRVMRKYRAYVAQYGEPAPAKRYDQLVARDTASRPATAWTREQLRDRMGMIVTIDRADTERSVAVESVG